MAGRLQDKVALVTGAGSGFGEGIAKRFATEGAKVVVADINAESGQRVADEIGSATFVEAESAVDGFGVGSHISGARAVDFTADLKQVEGLAVAKRGRQPGSTPNPRLERLDLA